MGIKEFSDSFDTLLDSYANTAQFGDTISREDIALDEYEKSLFLTDAQEKELLSLYNGKNIDREGFEKSEEIRRYLAPLIMESKIQPLEEDENTIIPEGIEENSKFFRLPQDLWFITYEAMVTDKAACSGMATLEVVPARQDEYHRLRKNPFRGISERRALRFDFSDGMVEIISDRNISYYYVRYVRKVTPIILIDLPDGLKIDGSSAASGCLLHESLHRRILDRAVRMALQSKIPHTENTENR